MTDDDPTTGCDDLTRAKRRAAARGKEPFDLDAFERRHGVGRIAGTRERRAAEREYDYYVIFADVMTVDEYAHRIWHIRGFWDGP